MPRVRFLTPIATADAAYHEGSVHDVPAALASAWAKSGNCELVRDETTETPERGSGPVETPERKTPAKRAPSKK